MNTQTAQGEQKALLTLKEFFQDTGSINILDSLNTLVQSHLTNPDNNTLSPEALADDVLMANRASRLIVQLQEQMSK